MFDSPLVAVIIAVIPGIFAWWSGQRLVRFINDPVLAERSLARAGQVTQVTTAAIVVLVFLPHPVSDWLIPLVIVGVALGSFQARRRLLEERWSVGHYLMFMTRLWMAWLGFWMVLAITPYVVLSAGSAARIVGPVLAGLLIGWYAFQHPLFVRILGAVPLVLPDYLHAVLR